MAARQARRTVVLTDQAKDELVRFRRDLSVRFNRDLTYSEAIIYAMGATETAHAWIAETRTQQGLSPVDLARVTAMIEGGEDD